MAQRLGFVQPVVQGRGASQIDPMGGIISSPSPCTSLPVRRENSGNHTKVVASIGIRFGTRPCRGAYNSFVRKCRESFGGFDAA
jgi:hypothetical protein